MPGSMCRWNSSVCVVDAEGRIVREGKVDSEPEALIAWFAAFPVNRWLLARGLGHGYETEGSGSCQDEEILHECFLPYSFGGP